MMNKIFAAAALSACLLAAPAFAQKKKPAAKGTAPAAAPAAPVASGEAAPAPASAPAAAGGYRAPYGMAGCGLGSLLIKSPSKWPQVGASILNGLYSNNTFGMTSGTSNCKSAPAGAQRVEQETFVSVNLNQITQEAAQGNGTHLASFADVLGCKDVGEFARVSQEKFDFIFEVKEASSVLTRTQEVIRARSLECVRA